MEEQKVKVDAYWDKILMKEESSFVGREHGLFGKLGSESKEISSEG